MTAARALALLLVCLALAGCGGGVRDVDGDGAVRITCFGDSNSLRAWVEGSPPSWCEYVGDLVRDRGWTIANMAMFGAGAIDEGETSGGASLYGGDWIREAMGKPDRRPDVAVLAYGTNDAKRGYRAAAIVQAILDLRAILTQSHVRVLVATIPPTSLPGPAHRNGVIDQTNAMLREVIPARDLVDFHADVVDTDFDPDGSRVLARDGIHLNAALQRRWAARVVRQLEQ